VDLLSEPWVGSIVLVWWPEARIVKIHVWKCDPQTHVAGITVALVYDIFQQYLDFYWMFVHRWNTQVHLYFHTWRLNRVTVRSWNIFAKPSLKFSGTISMSTGLLFHCLDFWIVCLAQDVFVLSWKTPSQHLHRIYYVMWSLRLARLVMCPNWLQV
jgi:hypothetical protein